ncbi:MAG: hypothetical protein HC827_09075 [Cyanobacteria bacterium RM1_2_2]|nr:hypothetical protein [Cyanobacteria bacterium RM1_2_2]
MVLRGEHLPLVNGIQPVTIENPPPKRCDHRHALPGLDAHYCPECKKSILAGTPSYQHILKNQTG